MVFIIAPMYLFHQFFEGKATEHLPGEGVKAEFITPKPTFGRLGSLLGYFINDPKILML
jgi:hypothetical protein